MRVSHKITIIHEVKIAIIARVKFPKTGELGSTLESQKEVDGSIFAAFALIGERQDLQGVL